MRACPRGARPRLLALPVPPAPEGALPLWAGTCPFTTFGGSPIAQESNARSHHRHRECEQQGETRRPRELQESSETYSFPTACASRRGDVTGPGVQGGQAAGRRAAPPPRLRPVRDGGRDAPFLSGPALHLVALGAGAHGLRGRLLERGLFERLSPKACGGGANGRGRGHTPLPHHLPHPRERSKQAVAQGAGVGHQGCEVDFPQTLPPFPHVFIKSSPRVETTIAPHQVRASPRAGGVGSPTGPRSHPAPPLGPPPVPPQPDLPRLAPPTPARPLPSSPPFRLPLGAPAGSPCPALSRRSLGNFSVFFLLDFPFGLSEATYRLPFTSIKFNKQIRTLFGQCELSTTSHSRDDAFLCPGSLLFFMLLPTANSGVKR